MLLCFVGKVCSPLWSTWEASVGEGKSGVEVARQVRAGQTFPQGRATNNRNDMIQSAPRSTGWLFFFCVVFDDLKPFVPPSVLLFTVSTCPQWFTGDVVVVVL